MKESFPSFCISGRGNPLGKACGGREHGLAGCGEKGKPQPGGKDLSFAHLVLKKQGRGVRWSPIVSELPLLLPWLSFLLSQ